MSKNLQRLLCVNCLHICVLVLSFLLLTGLPLHAKNYYFSSTGGNDAYTSTQAQNIATPWKSLTKLNAIFSTLTAGDSVLFKRGEVFYGSIVVSGSGSLNKHIVLGAYGTGANPIISGFTTMGTFTATGGGTYQATATAASSNLNIVTVNGQPQQIGRYPNANAANGGYLTYESFNDTLSITDNELTGTVNWKGAEVVIRKKLWVLDRCKIVNHTGTTISYTNTNGSQFPGNNNYGYFIQNDVRTLDQFGEWYFDPTTKNLKMYFGTVVPTPYVVKAATVDVLVNISSAKYITLDNLSLEGANNYGVYCFTADFISIKNCDFNNIGGIAIDGTSVSDLLIENTNTTNILSNAIKLACGIDSNVTIRNCNIKKTGAFRGMGLSSSNSYKAISANFATNLLIENNRVDTTGYIAIEFNGSNVTIKNNVVNYFCYNKDDGGGIYSWGPGTDSVPQGVFTNRVIKDNIVMNGIGAPEGRTSVNAFVSGIYLDGRTMNVDITGNSIFNIGKNGIHCNNPNNVKITGNTSFNTLNAVSFMRWPWGSISDLTVKKNIFYPKLNTQRDLYYTNAALNEPVVTPLQTALQSLGNIDSNYISTSNEVGFIFECYSTSGGPAVPVSPKSFDGWRAFSTKDNNSKKPFREVPKYIVRSTSGPNLFANGSFLSNITGVNTGGNVAVAWDNTGKISGGSLKIEFTVPVANKYIIFHGPVGAISAAKNYVFRFTTLGTTPYGIVRAYLRKTASPYTSLTPIQLGSFGLSAKVHEFLFTAPTTDAAGGSFVIEVEQNSGITYIDNIQVYEADATAYNIDDYLRIEYNPTTIAKTISLGANYIGVDATYYPGTITLQPFASKILVKDTSVIRQALAGSSSATAINCFGGTSTVTVSASGGIPPYTGTGTFTVSAGSYTYTVKDLTGAAAPTTINVTQPAAALKATVTAGTIPIFGTTTTVTVTASGGTAPYTGTGTFLNIIAGTYTYTVRDAKGCNAAAAITITQPTLLKVNTAAAAVNCFGGTTSVAVTASGGIPPYTGTGTFIVGAGTYSYFVRDAAGASLTTSLTVTQPSSALNAIATAGVINFFGGTTTVTVTATGGTSPYTGTGIVSNVTAGTYTYIVRDAKGCSATATITIAQPPADITVTATTPAINCFGSSANINISATGGVPPYTGTGTYPVSAGRGSLKLEFPSVVAGTYTSLYYTVGAVSASKNYILRFTTVGTTANGSVRAALRQTFTPWGLLTARQTGTFGTARKEHEFIFTAPVAEAAASFIIDINQNSGTTYIDNIALYEADNSNNLKGDNLYVYGGFESGIANVFATSANANQVASWDTTSKITAVYYFTVKDANSSSTVTSGTIIQPTQLQAAAAPGIISVYGGFTTVNVTATGGTAPYTGTGMVNNVVAGTYTYTVTDAKGCSATATITIAQPPADITVTATTPAINCFGSSANINISATGGVPPYTGTGTYAVSAGRGSLKLEFPSVVAGTYTSLYYTVGAVSASKNYILRFTTVGTIASGSVRAALRQTFTPWAMLTARQTGTFGTARKEHEFIFAAPVTEAAASFIIDINQNSGTTYIDNIALYEADNSNNLKGDNLYVYGGFESGIANVFATSANANQVASWDTTSKITAVYYFTVKDANSSSTVTSGTVIQPTQLQAAAAPGTISVYGGSTTVNVSATGGTAPYTGTGTVNNVVAGTYTYTVTDAKGCSATATITIAQPPADITVTATTPAINCFGSSANINISATGGVPPYTGTGTYPVSAGRGSLKLEFPSVVAGTYTSLYYTVGAVSASKNYILRFTTVGTTASGSVRAALRQTFTPWAMLTARQTGTFGTARKEHEFIFTAPVTEAAASFIIDINQNSGTTYIDNIALYEADNSNNLKGDNLYVYGGFESGIANVFATSANANQVASWDTTSKITAVYYFTVKDANSSSTVTSGTVIQPTQLQAAAAPGIISVYGGFTTVNVTATGGTAPYTGTGMVNNVVAGTYTYTVTDAKGCSATATITIAQPPADITVTATTPAINCFGSSANINISATGGVPPYTGTGTYAVSAGRGSLKLEFPSVVAGTYTSLYYTVGAVSASKNYILRFTTVGTTASGSVRAALRQTFTPWAMLTARQTGTFGTARKEHEFIFTAPVTEAAASFIIDINQNSGTTYIDNIALYEADNSNNLKGDNLYVYGGFESGIANVFATSANANQVASWDTTSKITAVYYFTVKDANSSSTVTSGTVIQPTQLQAAAAPGTISVYGGSTTVNVTATGGTAPYTGTGMVNNVVAGTYTYTVTDAKGCSASATITITQPPAPLLPVTTVAKINCFGKTVVANVAATGGVPPYTGTGNYTVSAGKGSVKLEFPAVVAGTYTSLYYTIGAVSASKNYIIRFTTFGSTASGGIRAAFRQTFTPWGMLTARQTGTFGIGRQDHEFIFAAPVTEANASFIIDFNQNSGTTYIDNIAIFEADDSNNLKANNLYVYGEFESGISNIFATSPNTNHIASWDTTSKISGTYYYVINDADGKTVTAVVNTTQPGAPLQVTATQGVAVTVTGGSTTVTVSATGGTAPYTGTGIVSNVKVGTYTYTVTDASGCSASKTITITQVAPRPAAPATRSAANNSTAGNSIAASKEFGIMAYPNPASSNFNLVIEGGTNERVLIVIANIDGKQVYSSSGNSNQHYTFGTAFPTGLYIMKVTQGNIVKTLKLIKIK